MGGWWTRGVGREKTLGFGEECGDKVESNEEDEDWFSGLLSLPLPRKVSGLEAEQPMN